MSRDALYQLRSDPGVVADLEARIERYRVACGEGYTTSSQQGRKNPQGRWRTTLFTATFRAMRDNARNNTMINNLDALR